MYKSNNHKMKFLKVINICAFFMLVVVQSQFKISTIDEYNTYKGFQTKLKNMSETTSLTEEKRGNLVQLNHLLANYEKNHPELLEDSNSSSEVTPPRTLPVKSVTVRNFEPSLCTLHLHIHANYNINTDLERLSKKKYIHLLKYKIEFYKVNESNFLYKMNSSGIYNMATWFHTYTDQGKNLLSLNSDFDLKSFSLLTAGVEEYPIKIYENKENCFAQLNSEDQKTKLATFLFDNFFDKSGKEYLYEPNLCYQKIDIKNFRGKLVNECCNIKNECEITQNNYIDLFNIFLLIIKLIFFFICPLLIQKLFFSQNIGKFDYSVPINKPGLKKTMLIKRVNSDFDTVHRASKFLTGNKCMQQFSNFRKLVRCIPSDEIISVNFSLLDISIDHAELLSKDDSPIHFLHYIYSTLIRCQCGRSHPFRTCCWESIVGSWSPNFLWCRLQKKCEMNNSCRECLSWFAIFRFISAILLILLLPLPFYVKVLYFYNYEKDIFNEREKWIESLGIEENIYQMLLQGVYKYICYLGLFLCYFISALVFMVLRTLFPSQIRLIINQCVRDFSNINRFECFRMIVSHLVLPFEKFGILGLVVGVFYWPIVIPISLVLTFIYCIPMVYIMGRVFILERPQCIDASNQAIIRSHGSHSISRNVSSIANCFFLEHISPKSKIQESTVTHEKPLKKSRFLFCCSINKTMLLSLIKNIIIGIIFVTLLISLSIMYMEAFGFLFEIIFLSLLGVFTNGRQMIFYLSFALIVIFYITLFLHHIKWKYSSFSHHLFEVLQGKLQSDIMRKMARCGEIREYTAFKYFTPEETKSNKGCSEGGDVRMRSDLERPEEPSDNIEYLSGKLHWTVNSLVIFMDGHDVVRMPKDLFWRVCNLNTPSSPGPLWKTLYLSTAKLFGVFVYLAILLLALLYYTDSQSEHSRWLDVDTNIRPPTIAVRLIFLFFLALLPSIVYIILTFCRCHKEAPTMGEGIAWIIKSYRKSWPVSDLVFENSELPKSIIPDVRSGNGDEGDREEDDEGGNVVRNEMPLKVDLLITLKDEPVYDPNRISMASNGSVLSLTSVNKLSPDELKPSLKHSNMAPLVGNNSSLLQRPLLSQNALNKDSTATTTVDIELNELHKLESHVS